MNLCELSALCGELRESFTTEGTERTEKTKSERGELPKRVMPRIPGTGLADWTRLESKPEQEGVRFAAAKSHRTLGRTHEA